MLQLAERRKKRGRPTTTQISKRQAIEREIFRLGMGLLPGEEEPPPPPTNDQLLDSAQLHPEDHGASIEAADADSDDPDNDDIQDGDASGEGDEGPIVAEKISRPRQAPKLSKHQYDECVARVKEVKAGTADNFMFLSPEPTMKKRFSKPAHTLQSVIVWLPQYLWRRSNLGVPDQPPCPRHGFHSRVTEHDTARPRYYSDTSLRSSGWIVGSVNTCALCKSERAKLKADGNPIYKQHHHYFRSYNPKVTEKYFQSESWNFIAYLMPVRLTFRRGVSTNLAQLVTSSCTMSGGSNPTAIDSLLQELHGVDGDTKRLIMLLHQLCASKRQLVVAPQRQLVSNNHSNVMQVEQQQGKTLWDAWNDADDPLQPLDVSLAELGACNTPARNYLQQLVVDILTSKTPFMERWREQHIGGQIFSMDHSCKALKVTMHKNRFTIMNEIGQIVLAVSVISTSYKDPALAIAFKALCKLWLDGRALVQLVYIDATKRDGPGVRILLKPIMMATNNESEYTYPGEISIFQWNEVDSIAKLCADLKSDALNSTVAPAVLSLDCEWHATFIRGEKRHRVALVQVGSLNLCLLERQFGARGGIPLPLLQLLRDPELLFVGRKIEQDLKYLDADYGCNLVDVTRWKDLKDIANSKPSVIDRNWSLQDLAATFVGVKLSKGDTRTSNWELPGLSIDQIKYAAADVGIAVEIYARLCPPLLSTDPAGVAGAAQRA